MESLKRHTTKSEFDVTNLDKLPKVGIVYSYSNVDADVMTPFLNGGYQGIVHAGVGNGNIHQNLFPMLEKRVNRGFWSFAPAVFRQVLPLLMQKWMTINISLLLLKN